MSIVQTVPELTDGICKQQEELQALPGNSQSQDFFSFCHKNG